MKKQKQGPTFKQRFRKLKRSSVKGLDSTKKGVKRTLNINKYNKYLFIFEAVLFVSVLDEYLESVITGLNLNLYINILLFMLLTGTLFTIAFENLEKLIKRIVAWIVRINGNKIIRIVAHLLILSLLFYLYGKVFFGANIGLEFSIGLTS